jgi:hypothetical protein
MAILTTLYWRDIPAQVTAKKGRKSARIQLSDRFQEAIDRAAMRAGMAGTDAYLEQWRRVEGDCGDDLEAAVAEQAARLEGEYDDQRLARMVTARGVADDPVAEV